MITRLPIGNLKVLRGRPEQLPLLSCPGVGAARFRGGRTFGGEQGSTQGNVNIKLLSPSFGVVRQQRQLVQPFWSCAAASAIAERAADLRPALPQKAMDFLTSP